MTTAGGITVRPIRDNHRTAVAALMRTHGIGGTGPWEMESGRQLVFDHLVAVEDGQVVGWLEGRLDADGGPHPRFNLPYANGAWLYWIVVSPDHRRCGIGRALINAAATVARDRGCEFIGGLVDQNSPWEERLAFLTQCGLLPLVPADPSDAVGNSTQAVIAATSAWSTSDG